jgi:surface protein
MKMKKVLAVVMSLCMTAGAVSYGTPVITQSITAQAAVAKCYSLDKTTGVLSLSGEVDGDALRGLSYSYKRNVTSIIAEEGTVLPEDCSAIIRDYSNCTSIDLSKADTSKVTDMSYMFDVCNNLTQLDISGFDTSNVTNMEHMFSGCGSLEALDVSNFNTSKVTDMSSMFSGCKSLKALDVSGFNTSNVTDMEFMFQNCSNLLTLDVTGFDTGKVTIMDFMFGDCQKLTTIDVSGFDTSNVTNIAGMFANSYGLRSLDLSAFDTSNVTNMSSMFDNCTSLKSVNLSGFDTSNVIALSYMFEGCFNLTQVDLSSFNTSKVNYMGGMFYRCSGLKSLDLSNFDMRNVTDKVGMFNGCTSLNTLTLGETFTNTEKTYLIKGDGWVNANDPKTVISGNGEFAIIENSGKNTYKRLPIEEETTPTYPTNIQVEYSTQYRQVRFTWDKVEGADRYGIAVYLAGKWRVQNQNITGTVYTSPKNLTPGKTYKVAIAARVNGKWDTANAIKNAVTVTIKGNSYVKPDRELRYGAELYVIADEITLYRGPDTSYGKVTTIPQKTYLQELGVMNNNNNWAFIKYNGQYGWVQMKNDKGIWEIKIMSPTPDKPVIYLYPEKETDVHVEVELTEADLATTYPKYNNGWDVVAKPDGSLVNKADGTHHRYLFWDAVNCRTEFDFSKGFCVAGSDTENFLKEKLSYMGLTEDEMNEFIVYWLPRMEHNKYNLISFQSEKYTDSAKLTITPTPDSMLRVFMTYVPLEEAVEIEPQELSTFERSGFTVVEWGGSEI